MAVLQIAEAVNNINGAVSKARYKQFHVYGTSHLPLVLLYIMKCSGVADLQLHMCAIFFQVHANQIR